MSNYQQRIMFAENAGFDVYLVLKDCTILTNTKVKSPYNGECIDIFEDGRIEQYCQFPGQTPTFTIQ